MMNNCTITFICVGNLKEEKCEHFKGKKVCKFANGHYCTNKDAKYEEVREYINLKENNYDTKRISRKICN